MKQRKPARRGSPTDWRGLFLLTQLGVSVMAPPLFFVFAARWACARFSIGPWLYVAAIAAGLFVAAVSVADLVRPLCRPKKKPDDPNDSD